MEPRPGAGPARCQVPHSPVLQHLPHFPSRAAPALELYVLLWGSDMTAPAAHAVLHDEQCGPGHAVGARTRRVNTPAPFSPQPREPFSSPPPGGTRRHRGQRSCRRPAPLQHRGGEQLRPGPGAGTGGRNGGRDQGPGPGPARGAGAALGLETPSRRRGAATAPRQPALWF